MTSNYKRHCAVHGCTDITSSRHRFPKPENLEIVEKWIAACGNSELSKLSPEHLNRSYRVCDRHFSTNFKVRNNRLQHNAIPTLFCFTSNNDAQSTVEITEEHSEPTSEFQICPVVASTPVVNRAPSNAISTDRRIRNKRTLYLLQHLRYKSSRYLTQTEKFLFNELKKNHKLLDQQRRRLKLVQKRPLSKQEMLNIATSEMEPHIANFIQSQYRLSKSKTAHGRRYTLDDKILGLILMKQSYKGYRLHSTLFPSPTRRTLAALLSRIPIKVGVNEAIFRNLKLNVEKLQKRVRVCILMFDEMALEPHLDFNRATKEFDGFVDTGLSSQSDFANHALVFMLKGICKNWKQPIFYSFAKGTTTTESLIEQIIIVVSECQKAGLFVVATISDQGRTNVAAINFLVKHHGDPNNAIPNLKRFAINDQHIVHIYDPPHLLKGIRNNFLVKNLCWEENGIKKIGKWSDIVDTYNIDNESGQLRSLPKLTYNHVHPQRMQKMKVSVAARIFSYSVATIMSLFYRKGIVGLNTDGSEIRLGNSASATSHILLFFDQLFDSVNGHSFYTSGKRFKCVVSSNSGHIEFWQHCRLQLQNMNFITTSNKHERPPSLNNWAVTTRGLEYISKYLKDTFGINYFRPRVFNQDPLENFFGQMRQHGGRNSNPSVGDFKNYFKTLLLNNMVCRYSIAQNCEDSLGAPNIINNVKGFVTQGVEDDFFEVNSEIFNDIEIVPRKFSFLDKSILG